MSWAKVGASIMCMLLSASVAVGGSPLADGSWLDSATSALKGGLHEAEDETVHVASQVEKVTADIGRAAVDTAVESSGKCPMISRERKEIAPLFAPKFAANFQHSLEEGPSSNQERCKAVVRNTIVEYLGESWHDPTGLSGKIIEGLSGEILQQICSRSLLHALRDNEARRETDPLAYRKAIEKTLLEEVLTDDWLKTEILQHCGNRHAARLQAKMRTNMRTNMRTAETFVRGQGGVVLAVAISFGLAVIIGIIGFLIAARSKTKEDLRCSRDPSIQQFPQE